MVVGEVVATVKHSALDARKLLIVQPLDAVGQPAGGAQIAVDAVGVGPGERVLLCDEGGAAAAVLGREGPVRAVLVGRVDSCVANASSSEIDS